MTRREGRDVSERRSGIEENEKQPIMARPITQWSRCIVSPL